MNMREKQRFKGRNLRERTRRLLAVFLCVCMMLTIMPAIPGNIATVKAAGETPSVTAYATKAQLNGTTFTPDGDGKSNTIGKLVFGKNSSGNPQEWYILGKDIGVSGENTILFAASSITAKSKFAPGSYGDPDEISISEIPSDDIRATLKDTYTYEDGQKYDTVYRNHYGISTLRAELRDLAQNINYFTVTEQNMMNTTPVKTPDTRNGSEYTTKDKLYALKDGTYNRIYAGSSDSTAINVRPYHYERNYDFWLRTPEPDVNFSKKKAYYVDTNGICGSWWVYSEDYVQPATNLNLTNVLFASAAKAASSGTVEAGPIAEGTAMTLRLDGSSETIGAVVYNGTTGEITAQNDVNAAGPVSLVIQGKDDENDWFYSVKVDGKTVVTTDQIETACCISGLSLADCKIWLETTIDNVTYAKEATTSSATISSINAVEVSDVSAPVANADFDWEGTCNTPGIATTNPAVTYLYTDGNGNDVEVSSGKADWNRPYKAKITLAAGAVDDTIYELDSSVSVTVNSGTLGVESSTVNPDGTLTITTQPFVNTAKRKIESVTPPTVPSTFTNYYGHEGYDPILTDGGNGELGTQAEVRFETDVRPTTKAMDVTWTIESAGGGAYDKTPGASNTFRWTIPASEFVDYNASDCQGYDSNTGTITGTVTIANKAATPVAITGTDSSVEYTGAVIDVSQYFNIDANAGSATYSDVTGSGDGKGVGTLVGSQLTVTQTGEFQIKVNTAPNGIYAAGEETITLTVENGNIQYTMSDYSGNYDGQPHSISLTGLVPDDATVTYSTDGTIFGTDNPAFTNVGTYTVYYSISKDNYNTSNGSKTVTINKKPVTIKADEQNIIWGNIIDQSRYTTDGLATGDSIARLTLSPSTSALTDNGKISVSDVKIVNAAGEDVTSNYDITPVDGTLKITHDTSLAPERIEAKKTKTSYIAGDTLNVDDITVTAHYADGYSEAVTGFTTNADGIDMATVGEKTLTISYTKNGGTKTKDISLTVSPATPYIATPPSAAAIQYGQALGESALTGGVAQYSATDTTAVVGTFVWKEVSIKPTVADSNKTEYTVVFKPTDTVNYNTVETKITLMVNKATPYIATPPSAAAIQYGQALGESALTGGVAQYSATDTTAVVGTFVWKEVSIKPTVADSDKTEYVVIFKPTDKDNYNEVETKITLTVNKVDVAPNKPESTMNAVYTNDAVGKVTLPEGWVWQDTHKTKALEVGKAVTATAIYNGADKGNYVMESVEVSIIRGAPAAGTTNTSDDGKATYKVTASGLTKGTVTYVAPTNKNATTVSIPATVTIDGVTYKVTSIADNAFANNKKLTKVTIGSNVKTIGKKAFYKCTKLKTVKLGKNVTTIGSNAFYGCSKLTTVTMGSNVTTISDKAFYKCTALTKITIPTKVKKIGKQAFYGCKKLKTITIKTTKLTSSKVGSKAFKGIYSKATIKVPKSKLTSYKKILKAKGVSSKATIKK